VPRVADGDDPGLKRDLGAGEAVPIAVPVPALVDSTYERRDLCQQRDTRQQRGADRRVLVDLLVLGLRELARLGEQLVADADLADVMEQCAVRDLSRASPMAILSWR
jgi:hypothetical protein